ncbi:MAG: hypothetical protein U9P10_03970 [Thermodesulfobacteriota bacterium]|nr:hypothetical protein [Thermodesulfobacteriota bacterium]
MQHFLVFRPLTWLVLGATHYLAYKTGKKSGKNEAGDKHLKKKTA